MLSGGGGKSCQKKEELEHFLKLGQGVAHSWGKTGQYGQWGVESLV